MSSQSRKQRERFAPPALANTLKQAGGDDIESDEFKPDYAVACMRCGRSPCVIGMRDGEVVFVGGLCGVCLWSVSDLADSAQ
jgi:hypothetical protein